MKMLQEIVWSAFLAALIAKDLYSHQTNAPLVALMPWKVIAKPDNVKLVVMAKLNVLIKSSAILNILCRPIQRLKIPFANQFAQIKIAFNAWESGSKNASPAQWDTTSMKGCVIWWWELRRSHRLTLQSSRQKRIILLQKRKPHLFLNKCLLIKKTRMSWMLRKWKIYNSKKKTNRKTFPLLIPSLWFQKISLPNQALNKTRSITTLLLTPYQRRMMNLK